MHENQTLNRGLDSICTVQLEEGLRLSNLKLDKFEIILETSWWCQLSILKYYITQKGRKPKYRGTD